MKIAILGTRGIPNAYGGFEQFAEYLSFYLANNGHEVFVYCSSDHQYRKSQWSKVNLIHKYDPENKIGTIGQFVYDLNCIIDSRKRNFDVILQLGYTSSSVWGGLFSSKSKVLTNMDGLEWKRSKYSVPVKQFLKIAERLAVFHSNFIVADSIAIQDYLDKKYKIKSEYIPYGANVFNDPNDKFLEEYDLKPYGYNMLIARLEPENSIEIILNGAAKSKISFIVIGNHNSKYGKYLKKKFNNYKNIKFLGAIYNIELLNNIRFFSNIYFHGHTVGGTNPSLLEAMGSYGLVCAHQNKFNRAILGSDGLYFKDSNEVTQIIKTTNKHEEVNQDIIKRNLQKIKELYSWEKINKQYEDLLLACLNKLN